MKLLDQQTPCLDGLNGVLEVHTEFGPRADFQVLAANQDLTDLIVLRFVQHLANALTHAFTCGVFVGNVAGGLDFGRELTLVGMLSLKISSLN